MAKDLPYFKFFCSEWNDGDITLESFETQGLFINLCSYYWSNECRLSLDKAMKKFALSKTENFDFLINSKIIKIINGNIKINFLDEQKKERGHKSLINKENGAKGGRPKKRTETEKKPNAFISLTETKAKQKAIREEKKREEKNNEKINFSFNDFWNSYNVKNKGSKIQAEKVFNKLNISDLNKIKETVKDFVGYKQFESYQHPHAVKYLRDKRWEDEIPNKENVNLEYKPTNEDIFYNNVMRQIRPEDLPNNSTK